MELSGDLMDIDRPLSGEHLTDGCKSAAGAMAPEPELQLDIPYDSRQDAPLMQFLHRRQSTRPSFQETSEMNAAYVVGHIAVKNVEKWAEYRGQVPATLAPWGAELVFRGNQVAVLAGENPHPEIVVIRFPDIAAVNGWYTSPAYQALIPLRQQAADIVLLSYVA